MTLLNVSFNFFRLSLSTFSLRGEGWYTLNSTKYYGVNIIVEPKTPD
jgi:hypothetical protein